jgi:hypothetical protein
LTPSPEDNLFILMDAAYGDRAANEQTQRQ